MTGHQKDAREPYEFFGELGRDETGRQVYLARERTSTRLVAVRVDDSAQLTVFETLDARVPGARRCPICNERVLDWRSYCGHCGSDIAGVTGATRAVDVDALLRESGDDVELLGEMPRGDGGVPVYFGRERQTGRILALTLHADTDATGSGHISVQKASLSTASGSTRPQDTSPSETTPPATEGTGPTRQCPSCNRTYGAAVHFCPHDGSVLHVVGQTDDLIGAILADRYHVIQKLGQGGMGMVYLAEHVKMGRRCAIKVMRRSLSPDLSAVSRFGREAANASRINHPNVATIYDFGETKDHLVYIVMEYVEGEALARLIARKDEMSAARAIAIARQIADALEAAHRQRVVHRDLKPDNILIAKDHLGRDFVKVVDFGIAKAMISDAEGLTQTGVVVGTPRYMSPEQLINEAVDGRSDIYSLGFILFELLTGDRPFGDGPVDLPRRLTEPPPQPRDRNNAISTALNDLVVKALGRKPAERFASAAELRDALADPALLLSAETDRTSVQTSNVGITTRRRRSAAPPATGGGSAAPPATGGRAAAGSASGPAEPATSGDSARAPATPVSTPVASTGRKAGADAPSGTASSPAAPPAGTGPQRSDRAATVGPMAFPTAGSGDELETTATEASDSTFARAGTVWARKRVRVAAVAIVVLALGAFGAMALLNRDEAEVAVDTSENVVAPPASTLDAAQSGPQPATTPPAGTADVEPAPPAPGPSAPDTGPTVVVPRLSVLRIVGDIPAGATMRIDGQSRQIPSNRELRLQPDRAYRIVIEAAGSSEVWNDRLERNVMREWRVDFPVAPPPPPPVASFSRYVADQTDRFRQVVEQRDLSNPLFDRLPNPDQAELRDILRNPAVQRVRVTRRVLEADSTAAQARFLLTVTAATANDSSSFYLEYVADFMRRPAGWTQLGLRRQK